MRTENKNNILTIFLEGRIDTENSAEREREIEAVTANAPDVEIVLDAENLDYISSAGLRVLMKLRKQQGKKLPVVNVSPEVYDIFDTTGFTQILDIHKKMREISVEGLPVIGQGATARVYRMDRETVVKVFNKEIPLPVIEKERESSRNAFISGIPTAISYDIVRVGYSYGAVYELLDAQDFVKVCENDREHLKEHIRGFAGVMRDIHRIEVDSSRFVPGKMAAIQRLGFVAAAFTKEELSSLQKVYEMIPDRGTFIHGDCHPGNVMVQNGELVFIDMTNCGSGHPILDMGSMCMNYCMKEVPGGAANNPLTRGFSEEERRTIWDTFLRSYFETDDEAFLEKAGRQIEAVSSASALFVAAYMPGIFSTEFVAELKNTVFSYLKEAEPLCF